MKDHVQILVLSSKGHKKHVDTLERRRGKDFLPGQRVQIEGRGRVYVILRIDRRRHLADLLGEGAVRKIETGIPLALLRPARPQHNTNDMEIPA